MNNALKLLNYKKIVNNLNYPVEHSESNELKSSYSIKPLFLLP